MTKLVAPQELAQGEGSISRADVVSLTERLPSTRRAIVVCEPGENRDGTGWTAAGVAIGLTLGGPLGAALGGWAGHAISKQAAGGILRVGIDELGDAKFPPGHPIPTTKYAQHPIDDQRYIPVNDYASTIFDEKRRELTILLQALGARILRVRALEERLESSSGRLGLMTPTQAGQVAVAANGRRLKATSTALRETIESIPRGQAHVPEGLIWYQREPEWQSIAKGRLELGTQMVTCRVTKRSLEELSGEFDFGLESLGLSLGADGAEEAGETLEFHADFRERRTTSAGVWVVVGVLVTAIAVAFAVWLFR